MTDLTMLVPCAQGLLAGSLLYLTCIALIADINYQTLQPSAKPNYISDLLYHNMILDAAMMAYNMGRDCIEYSTCGSTGTADVRAAATLEGHQSIHSSRTDCRLGQGACTKLVAQGIEPLGHLSCTQRNQLQRSTRNAVQLNSPILLNDGPIPMVCSAHDTV